MKSSSGCAKSWKGLQENLEKSSSMELIKIIRDLYDLNEENRRFLCTRLVSTTSKIQDYKEIIRRGVYPDALSNERFDLRSARKAISDFKRACDDPSSVLELMVYYVEQGNQCTVDYGDIDEHFYSSIESMFDATCDNTEVRKCLKDRTAVCVSTKHQGLFIKIRGHN